jgi:MutL protein
MSYSVANVLVEAGAEKIGRWLPFPLGAHELRDHLRNKMIRPTSIPFLLEDLWLEQAVCREALRLSLHHHRSLAVGVGGKRGGRGIADIFTQTSDRIELVDLMKLDLVIGSGGVLSHAPNRVQAALMMLDGFGLQGVTELAVDSIFMMPHLGVFSTVHPQAAREIFFGDCLVRLGSSVVPVFPASLRISDLAEVSINGGTPVRILRGEVSRISCGGEAELSITPLHRDVDIGAGPGRTVTRRIHGGECGVILDGRNRPIEWAADCVTNQRRIFEQLGLAGGASCQA